MHLPGVVQSLVGNAGDDFQHGGAHRLDRPPLRPVGDLLDQKKPWLLWQKRTMVATGTAASVGRAGPDATIIGKSTTKSQNSTKKTPQSHLILHCTMATSAFDASAVVMRLKRTCRAACAEFPADQVAALGKYAVQAGAAPHSGNLPPPRRAP
jgi:hypothetical protein